MIFKNLLQLDKQFHTNILLLTLSSQIGKHHPIKYDIPTVLQEKTVLQHHDIFKISGVNNTDLIFTAFA